MRPNFSIILVDDHIVVRNGLKELIELMGPYTITAQFDNGKELLDSLPCEPVPDLIIMDLTMPKMNGLETMRKFCELNISYPVLILTLNSLDQTIVELHRQGVRGYLEKGCTALKLEAAIGSILSSGYYHSELLNKALIAEVKSRVDDQREAVVNQLTSRELQFLRLVCDSAEYTYTQISGIMGVSVRTIDGYREALFEKFDIKSKTGLVLFAIKNRIYEQ